MRAAICHDGEIVVGTTADPGQAAGRRTPPPTITRTGGPDRAGSSFAEPATTERHTIIPGNPRRQ